MTKIFDEGHHYEKAYVIEVPVRPEKPISALMLDSYYDQKIFGGIICKPDGDGHCTELRWFGADFDKTTTACVAPPRER